MKRIAIVGGGFSGTLAAVNLGRLSAAPLGITLVNHGYPAGRGIAYSTRRPEHLLNVAARNMSALPEHPNHFVEWLRTRTEFADTPETELRETFQPRRVYGDYVRSLALHYTRPVNARATAEIELIDDEVVDIAADGDGARLLLAGGRCFAADRVLLATGNEPPADLPGSETIGAHPAWCANPWLDWEARLPPPGGNLVLLGTGLTAVDAMLTVLALGWPGTVHAVSRHGLLPQSHFKGIDYPEFPPAEFDLGALGLDGLVRLVTDHCARLQRLDANPGIVVDKLRPHTQRIWQAFTPAERREFVARHAARWNVIRHRIAPSIHCTLADALASGRLRLTASGVTGIAANGPQVRVQLRDRAGTVAHLDAALAINCTGPLTRFSATRSRLLQNLLASGLVQPDEMDMGIRVGADFAAVGRDGGHLRFLYAIGPLLRGTLWESIAVPELRGQALRVAQTILASTATDASGPVPSRAPVEPAVMEYWI